MTLMGLVISFDYNEAINVQLALHFRELRIFANAQPPNHIYQTNVGKKVRENTSRRVSILPLTPSTWLTS